jgi:plasmid stabilization system protein ParE
MDCSVVWTEPAERQLQDVIAHIKADNPSAAERFALRLFRRIDSLAKFPLAGDVFTQSRRMEIRQVFYGKYRIFYRVRRRLKRIEILAVWHGARQDPKFWRR